MKNLNWLFLGLIITFFGSCEKSNTTSTIEKAVLGGLELDILLPHDVSVDALFGSAISINGNIALVGASGDSEQETHSGSAYIFHFVNNQWHQYQKLLPENGQGWDFFGGSVALSDNYAFVGAATTDDLGSNSGKVYVFQYSDITQTWIERQTLFASDGSSLDLFGYSISVFGNKAIIGARNAESTGAAYIFKLEDGQWIEEQMLLASDGQWGDEFGYSVSMSNFGVIIGAFGLDDGPLYGSGAVYVFRFNSKLGLWEQTQKLTSSDNSAGDQFGFSVALHGTKALVGAVGSDDLGENSGSVYFFKYNFQEEQWVEEQKLLQPDGQPGDKFGRAVALEESRAVIGSPGDDMGGIENYGSATIFDFENQIFVPKYLIYPPDGPSAFTVNIAIHNEKIIFGAHHQFSNSGAAYALELPLPPICSADFDNDGVVGPIDLAFLLGAWGETLSPADLNYDGIVNPIDLGTFLGQWGSCE